MDLAIEPCIYTARVMHKRLFPKINQFAYKVYYVALPLPAQQLPSKIMKFYNKDHGPRDGTELEIWARDILDQNGANEIVCSIVLVTMPRILGYVFNPVSFYLCMDEQKLLRAVICEVNNTFGETHTYLCIHSDLSPIQADQSLTAEKLFHVSPFLERVGFYQFRFDLQNDALNLQINFFDEHDNKQLITSMHGKITPLNAQSLQKAFFKNPLVTLKVIFLIHWQALKLVFKGIRYIWKPKQLDTKIGVTKGVNDV